MKTIFKLLWNLLAVIGLLTVVGFSVLAYFWFTNPYLQSVFNPFESRQEGVSEDQHPALSAEQEATLQAIGVDVSALPSEITPNMENCFVQKLGQKRVDEIKAGSSPTPAEVVKSQGCLNQ